MEPVVAIEEADKFAARNVDSGIAGAGQAPVAFEPQKSDARVGQGVGLADIGRFVGRRVVDQNQLEVVECLGQRALDTCSKQSRADVIDRHDNAYFRIAPFAHGLRFCGAPWRCVEAGIV